MPIRTSSGGAGSVPSTTTSDSQLVARLTDALLLPAHANSGVPVPSHKETSAMNQAVQDRMLEPLLPPLWQWLQMEMTATKLVNPLAECVSKHLSMTKVLGSWETLCSCGEKRQPSSWNCVSCNTLDLWVMSACIGIVCMC